MFSTQVIDEKSPSSEQFEIDLHCNYCHKISSSPQQLIKHLTVCTKNTNVKAIASSNDSLVIFNASNKCI